MQHYIAPRTGELLRGLLPIFELIDDSFDPSCESWAADRDRPTLLLPADSRIGLDERHVDALLGWRDAGFELGR